jgi:pyrophosphatase PpaX
MNNFDVALFDIDGTLLNTTQYVYGAYKSTLLTHMGVEMSWEQVSPVLGKPLVECYQLLSGLESVDHLMDDHVKFQAKDSSLGLVTAYPNAIDVLSQLRDAGIRIAAITSRGGEGMSKTLKIGGIAPYLELVITDADVTLHKPDPEGILKALTLFNVSPDRAIMIGDTAVDVLAGRNAGVKTVGVTYGFHARKIEEAKPDYVIDNILEVLPILLSKN